MSRENEELAQAIRDYERAIAARADLAKLLTLGEAALVPAERVRADWRMSRECPPIQGMPAAPGGNVIRS